MIPVAHLRKYIRILLVGFIVAARGLGSVALKVTQRILDNISQEHTIGIRGIPKHRQQVKSF